MIWFLLKKRWTNFFSLTNNTYELLMQVMYLIALTSLAMTAGYLYTISVDGRLKLQPFTLIRFLLYALYTLPVLFKFFPSIHIKPVLIQKYYPLTLFKAATIELFYGVFSTASLFFVAVFCILFKVLSGVGMPVLFSMFLCGTGGIILAENVLTAYYLKRKLFLGLLVIYMLVTTPLIGSLPLTLLSVLLVCGTVLLCGLFCLFYMPNELLIERPVMFFANSRSIILKIISRVSKFRIAIIFSFFIQTALSVLFIEALFDELQFLKFYMLSSVMYFSYCYNNTFGFFVAPAFNMVMAGNTIKAFVRFYLKALIPLFILYLFTLCLVFFLRKDVFTLSLVWGLLAQFLFCVVNGLLFSLIKIKNVGKAISFDQNNFNTNLLPTYILGGVSIVVGLIEDKPALYYGVLCLIAVYCVIAVMFLFVRQQYLLRSLSQRLASKS
jgi:hypothetical protein